jgi:hypothetical protein
MDKTMAKGQKDNQLAIKNIYRKLKIEHKNRNGLRKEPSFYNNFRCPVL